MPCFQLVQVESAGPARAMLQLIEGARQKMRLTEAEAADAVERSEPMSTISRTAAHCWALLLVRILQHIGEPTESPTVLPARAPPQAELDFTQVTGPVEWPEMDQSNGASGEIWE